eukprot:3845829-Ditylum_brightwellii.AAC.1
MEYHADNKDYPSKTIESNWDLVKQIVDTIQQLPSESQVPHIKGHQDDNCSYDNLAWAIQQNVDADDLAGSFLVRHNVH